jgi:hypothetical protein
MPQKLISQLLSLLLLLMIGCEKPSPVEHTRPKETKEDSGTTKFEEKAEWNEPSLIPAKLPTTIGDENVHTAEEKVTVLPKPIIPSFSKELLEAVSNWEKIPKGVFPLESVQLSEDVHLEARTQNGKVIAKSIAEKGSKVTILGMDGRRLVVANPNSTKLRGVVEIEKTDFKQMVAYLFEYRKNQREKLKEKPKNQITSKDIKVNKSNTPIEVEGDDFITDPLDFGHGRFCICRDCRERRLAQSGSLKTGFGLEP